MHESLIKTRKEIYEQLKKKVEFYLKNKGPELAYYYEEQEAYKNINFQNENLEDFIQRVKEASIVYLGDFHTFDQSSKNLQRLIKSTLLPEKEVIIGLEFVSQDDQIYIEQFLNEQITEREFLESINYKDSWRFPWNHYKDFFELSKKNNFKIYGLNSEGSLSDRDKSAARSISKLHQHNPDSQIFVLFGELHIFPDKLPKNVEELTPSKVDQVIIHQNIDEIYWQQIEKSPSQRPESSIVRILDNEFSLQNSPPWVKLESLVYWLENLNEDPEFDFHEYLIETGLKSLGNDTYDNFSYLTGKLIEAIGIEDIPKSKIDNFNLYDHHSLEFILTKISSFHESKRKYYTELLKQEGFFHISSTNIYYCSSYSVNRISYLTGIHLHNIIAEKNVHFENEGPFFTSEVIKSFFGYLASKIFNPYRKCDLYLDFVSAQEDGDDSKSLESVINFFNETIELADLEQMSKLEITTSAKKVGHALADHVYSGYSSDGVHGLKIMIKMAQTSPTLDHLTSNIENIIFSKKNFFTKSKKVF